ncbi:CDP-alcohol phosphatidyltransferase family protein [Ectothiorhodospiraceae bacterium WFHF3C12]|nr:CDP-alcohol phosphatidyltransferase family protein [Ectothiorhodospiraceae bacterium WFHF3C12]
MPDALAIAELAAGLALVLLLGALMNMSPAAIALGTGTYVAMAALLGLALPDGGAGLGWGNRATLVRAVLVCVVTGSLTDPAATAAQAWLTAALVLAALALDGVDGWVARRTGTVSSFGARFDMELDAFLILVLCLWLVVTGAVGIWVLAVGGMRYGFVLAGIRWRWLAAPLPESRRRKAVCVWQVVALVAAMTPLADATRSSWLAASALATLVISFAIDVRWLYRHART